MKNIILTVIFSALASVSQAMSVTQTTPIFNGVVAATQSVIMDLNAGKVDYLSVEAAYSTTTISTATFTDGSLSTATITFASTTTYSALVSSDILSVSNNANLAATQGSSLLVVSTASQLSSGGLIGSTFTINGSSVVGGVGYQVGASTNATAINIAAYINSAIPNITAAVSPVGGSTITLTCVTAGSFCNSYTVTSSTPAALGAGTNTGSSARFSGGNDNPSFTVTVPAIYNTGENSWSIPFSQTFTQGVQWYQLDKASNTAISIVNGINGTVGSWLTASTQTTTNVLIQSNLAGLQTNGYILTSTTGSLPANSANFSGGQDAAWFSIAGITKYAGINWAVGTSSVTASTAAVAAINSDPYLSTIIVATTAVTCPNRCGVVFASSTVLGVNPWSLTTSSTSNLAVSSSVFLGGTATAVNTTNSSINVPSHGFATGLPIWFKTVTGTAPGKLITQTGYFAVVLDANDFQLASSSTNALANPPTVISISTQTVSGGGSFTVGQQSTLLGPLGLTWYASNDNVNFNLLTLPNNVTPSIVTFSTSSAPSSTYWDFGQINSRYVKLSIAGPSAGSYNLVVTPYGKSIANGY